MNKTIDYYNSNANSFSNDTAEVDFTEIQDKFLGYLENGSLILDFGCGVGRDSKYFLSKGYTVDAIDGSEELCKIAAANAGIPVRQMYFSDFDEEEKYDGIWACASLLHLTEDELPDVMQRILKALKKDGIFYASFKYGNFQGERNGRFFTDMTEERLTAILKETGEEQFQILELWLSNDVRPGREDEKWINVIVQKTREK